MDILQRMKNVVAILENSNLPFEVYIQDQSIPLSERWEVFCITPYEMKEHDPCGPSFHNSLPRDFIMYDGPIDMDRGYTMNTIKMVEYIESALAEIAIDEYLGNDRKKDLFLSINLDEIKEEILEQNLGSFTYDW